DGARQFGSRQLPDDLRADVVVIVEQDDPPTVGGKMHHPTEVEEDAGAITAAYAIARPPHDPRRVPALIPHLELHFDAPSCHASLRRTEVTLTESKERAVQRQAERSGNPRHLPIGMTGSNRTIRVPDKTERSDRSRRDCFREGSKLRS